MPTVTLKGSPRKEYRVGETFDIPEYNASDNLKVSEVNVYIKSASSKVERVVSGYTFTKAGKYIVMIKATDNYDNFGYIQYEITVK